jgi:serine/threonine protein kinase
MLLSEHIATNKARLTVVDPNKRVPFYEADFNEMAPLAEGTQGMVYAVLAQVEGDETEQRYVVKRLRKHRALPSASISGSPSAATFFTKSPEPPESAPPAQCSEDGLIGLMQTEGITSGCPSFSFNNKSLISLISRRKKRTKKGPTFDSHAYITSESETVCDNNIIKLIHVIKHNDEDYALLPYCDLFLDIFLETSFKCLDSNSRVMLSCEIILDILNAVSYLNYQKDFVHRDIKPENIALCNGKWCLVDLECAVKADNKTKNMGGSPYYMHPWCFVDTYYSSLPGNDLYAVGQVLRDLLSLPSLYHSRCFRDLANEKVALHKLRRDAKWMESIPSSYTPDDTPYGKLCRLTEQMCGLMSDQPSIDDIISEIRSVHDEMNELLSPVSSDPSSLFSELYRSSRTDGYFSSSQDKAQSYMQEVPRMLERRRSSWGGILAKRSESSSDDSGHEDTFSYGE